MDGYIHTYSPEEEMEYASWAESTDQQYFEQVIRNVQCDLCGDDARGTTKHLEANGWELYPREQFCPTCAIGN